MNINTLLKRKWPLLLVLTIILIAAIGISPSLVSALQPAPPESGSAFLKVPSMPPGSSSTYIDIDLSANNTMTPYTDSPGWCASIVNHIYVGQMYPTTIYDYFYLLQSGQISSSGMPAYVQNIDWNRVAYILNNQGGYPMPAVQAAMWYYTNPGWDGYGNAKDALIEGFGAGYAFPGGIDTDAADALILVAAAQLNGGNFVPSLAGQIRPIVCDMGLSIQLLFYQCGGPLPPLPEAKTIVLLSIGVAALGGFVWYGVRQRKQVA